jgi:hypothetical protein
MPQPTSPVYDPQRQAASMFAWLLLSAIPTSVLGRLGLEAFRTTMPDSKPKPEDMSSYRLPLDMPVGTKEKKKTLKTASFVTDIHKKLSDAVYNIFVGDNKDGFLAGGAAKTPGAVPWLYGVGVPAMLATGLGGWTATDKLITNARRSERRSERDAAKEEYERLLQLAIQEARPKKASALDALATVRSKDAEFDNPFFSYSGAKERAGHYGSAVLAAAVLTALMSAGISGQYMWNKTKQRTKADLVAEAQRIRALQHMHGPGVPMHIPGIEEDDDETT